MKIGIAKINITPRKGTPMPGYFNKRIISGIIDPLYVRAIILNDGKKRIALIACDIVYITKDIVNQARKRITKETKIPGNCCMIWATHTHTGPAVADVFETNRSETYIRQLVEKISQAVKTACRNPKETVIGIGMGHEHSISMNRRFKRKDGSVQTFSKYRDLANLEPLGPIDPSIGLLTFIPKDEKSLYFLANFACHLDSIQTNRVSADFPAYAEQYISDFLGKPISLMYGIGCCGDIERGYIPGFKERNGLEYTRKLGELFGKEILQTYKNTVPLKSLQLKTSHEELSFKTRKYSKKEVVLAAQAARQQKDIFTKRVWDKQERALRNRNLTYAKEAVLLDNMPDSFKSETQVLTIGDIALVGLPGEVFCEIGMEIKNRSPFLYTFVISLANDAVGYIPTPRAFKEGGYAVTPARHCKTHPEAGKKIIQSVLKQLHKLKK